MGNGDGVMHNTSWNCNARNLDKGCQSYVLPVDYPCVNVPSGAPSVPVETK